MRFITVFGIAALAMALANIANAGTVYRWVDKQGNAHYTDQLPADISAAPVTVNAPPASTDASASSAAAKNAAAAKTDNSDECQKAKDKLVTYKAAAKISETDALGNTREYSDEDRQKLIDLTSQKIKSACGEQ